MPTSTPWGPAQDSKKLTRGIMFYSTAGHGGYHVSPTKAQAMHPALRLNNNWYEEDCEWARVALSFPELFTDENVKQAHSTLKDYDPDAYESWVKSTTGIDHEIPMAESYVKRKRSFIESTRDQYVVVSAVGDWHEKCPKGMVMCSAVRGGHNEKGHYASRDEAVFFVPAEEYSNRAAFGFVIDEARHQRVTK